MQIDVRVTRDELEKNNITAEHLQEMMMRAIVDYDDESEYPYFEINVFVV